MSANYCDGRSRREFLQAGSLAGLSLAQVLRLQDACAAEAAKQDMNCIFLFAIGGMAHQDMWDLKPNAPAEVRGEFRPIKTNVPGLHISDVLPGVATVMDKLAILRSMTHGKSDHGSGYHTMMTGKEPVGGNFVVGGSKNNNQHPSLGSVVSRLGKPGPLPPYICAPNFQDSGGPSFLGPSYGPFVIDADPAAPEFSVRDITLPTSVTSERNQRRQAALREVNRFERRVEEISRQEKAFDAFYEKAYKLMTSAKAKEAFDISREPEKVREEYGMTSVGQCCLLARRLVEAGCRYVSLENGHWDTHRKNTYSLRDLLCPAFDQAIPALMNDLEQRGLLENTLVVISTEFGRTPKINDLVGRDHWPNAFSILMGGAGLKTGQAIGATDKQAGEVADRPITPQDMAATVLNTLGIDHSKVMHTPLGRPVPLVDGGKPVTELRS